MQSKGTQIRCKEILKWDLILSILLLKKTKNSVKLYYEKINKKCFQEHYKGHVDKTKRGWDHGRGREEGTAGVEGVVGGKCRQLHLKVNKK